MIVVWSTGVSKLRERERERVEKLTDEVKAKDLDLQTILNLVEKATKILNEVAELCETAAKNRSLVLFVMDGLGIVVQAIKKVAAVLVPAVEKSRDLRENDEKNARLAGME